MAKGQYMKQVSVAVCVLLAIGSSVLAVVYFTKTAGNLPHFLPGYVQGSGHKHLKHGIACLGLAIVLLLGAWMASGQSAKPKSH
jgi:amino acid permease